MEDYAVYLSEEAQSDVAALHQFRILYDPESEAYHFFFEGEEDSLYFMPAARQFTDVKHLYMYVCGGKKNVEQVRNTIKSSGYDINQCLFFVDRDFDDLLGTQIPLDEYTYITDGYSIENDVSSLNSARIMMTDILRISHADPEFRRIEISLEIGFKKFYEEVRPLIAWILAAKQLGCNPNIRNISGLKGVMTIRGTVPHITKSGFAEFKRRVIVNGRVPPISAVLRWRRLLKTSVAKKWTRGKYEIWFFHTAFISALSESNSRRKQAGGRSVRISNAIREGQYFELLGGRQPPPMSLQNFLKARLARAPV